VGIADADADADAMDPASMPVGARARSSRNVIMVKLRELKSPAPGVAASR
jgi:hypothetical protein